MHISDNNKLNRMLSYGLYPLLFIVMVGYAWIELHQPPGQLGRYYPYYLMGVLGVMLLVEALHPLRTQWRMTYSSFFRRDLPFLMAGAVTLGLSNYLAGVAIVHFGLMRGESSTGLPLLPAVILALVIPDLLWYWLHRISHEGRGRFAQWCWSMHLAHHLPQQVYLLMHAVAHPLNAIMVRIILTVPLFFLGFSTEALFVANLIVGLQGLVSHFNVDIRVGWFNYVLIGTELHRYHHSSDPAEAKNYGAVVSCWDLLFGTFYYRPEQVPNQLGVTNPAAYPTDRQFLRVLFLPFKSLKRE